MLTETQIFFILLWVIGIPLGMRWFRHEEQRDYKDWKQREKDYDERSKGNPW
jgi:hypothetical protein